MISGDAEETIQRGQRGQREDDLAKTVVSGIAGSYGQARPIHKAHAQQTQ